MRKTPAIDLAAHARAEVADSFDEELELELDDERIEELLETGGLPADQSRQVAAEVVALALGDAYQRAILGIGEASDAEAFAQQIDAAVTHGFSRSA